MRIFENAEEAYPEILRDLVKFGREVKSNTVQNWKDVSDDFLMKEIQLYSFCIANPTDCVLQSKDPDWVQVEFRERLANTNPGEAWELRAEYWRSVMTDGKFCYTYGERLYDVIPQVVGLLRDNPGTRQAILSLWEHKDHYNTGGKKRVPCSMYYNLQIREGALDIIYHMRSSDYYEHFRNDVALARLLQVEISRRLDNVPTGKLLMTIDSLHTYKKDWGKLNIY